MKEQSKPSPTTSTTWRSRKHSGLLVWFTAAALLVVAAAGGAATAPGRGLAAPTVSLQPGNEPYTQIVVGETDAPYVDIYRATSENGPWEKIIGRFPTAAHTAVDYFGPVSEVTLYYRTIVLSDDGLESEPSPASKVEVPTAPRAPSAVPTAIAPEATSATFDKNNIITDAQLLNANAMTAAQIQSFLTGRGSVLANMTFSGSTAAQLIYNACQTHGISPYVVLVTLDKEQSLIGSSTTNLQARLNFAMGWGSSSNFADQINYGTRQFRLYYNNLGNYHDVQGTSWAVGQTRTVYDGTVTPANTATAGLFIYTPWIGQGGGGRTGIGGNYLFWDIWTNKFAFGGSTTTTPAPAAPSSVTATALSSSSLKVSWSDNSNNESNFVVYRWTGSTWAQIATPAANTTSYTDTGLQPSTTYFHLVCAQNSAGSTCSSSYSTATTLASTTTTTPPAAPSNLTGTALSSSSIKLGWQDNASNESGFVVFRWTGSTWAQIATLAANSTSYTDTGLQPSTTYFHVVCAQNTAGSNCPANYSTTATLAATTTTTPPAAPSNVVATALSSSSIKVTWQDNANNESGFVVFRWTGSTWAQIATLAANSTSYTDNGLQPSTTYFHVVCAQNTAGANCPSNYSTATTLGNSTATVPTAPSSLTATPLSTSSIKVSWQDNSNNETAFVVFRWTGSTWAQIATLAANSTSYTDTGLQPSTTYFHVVCAQNGAGANCSAAYSSATTLSAAATTAPAAPSGTSAAALSSSSIRVSWIDNSNNEAGFVVFRWTGSAWAQIATVGPNTTSYTDTGLQHATTYFHVVCAQNGAGANCSAAYSSATTLF